MGDSEQTLKTGTLTDDTQDPQTLTLSGSDHPTPFLTSKLMYKPQDFRARRNFSDHRLQSPQFTSDKLRPRDIKGLFPDQVTPHSSFLSHTGSCGTCKLHTYASYFFLDLYHSQPFIPSSPRSIFMTSQSFGHPREQSKW